MSTPSVRSIRNDDKRRYLVGEQLGAGGMGTIYRARDRLVGREVAYKRLRVDREAQRARLTALFRREYETLIGLQHPNTIAVYDYGFDEVGPYYTMELLTGDDLAHAAPLPWREACRVLRDVASALALVHARRLVHRDVSPNNVRLTREGPAKLLDFGALARFGVPTEIIGTPQFMAPECVRGDPIDQRADLFSLGALAYWALTRRTCFDVSSIEDLDIAWARQVVPPSTYEEGVPGALDELILTLLQRDQLQRPSSAAYVVEKLTTIAELTPEAAPREIALGYLRRPPLVERAQPLATLDRSLKEVMAGKGSLVLVEAAAGLGRSALLERFTLEARLCGATVLRGEGAGRNRPYDLCRRLVQAGLQTYPDPEGQKQDVDITTRVFILDTPEQRAQSAVEAVERRAKLAGGLRAKLLDFSLRGPLILVVDDAQNVDAESLSMLASMADETKQYPLLLVISVRSGESGIDPHVRTMLERAAAHLTLEPISEAGLEELVRTTFGSVPNAQLTTVFLQRESGGNPAVAMDLLRLLIQNGQINYASGTFALPPKVEIDAVARSDRALLARASDLDESAQAIIQVLSLHAGALTLEQLATATELAPRAAQIALERLEQRGIAFVDGGSHFMPSDMLRGAVVRTMNERQVCAHHEALARAILNDSDGSLDSKTLAGQHLIRSGPHNELAGAQLVSEASRDHTFEAPSFTNVTPRLKEAHAVMVRHGRTASECLDLLVPLSFLGFYGDLDAQRTYLDPTLDALAERTGLLLQRRLQNALGARLSLYVALFAALIAGLFTRRYAGRALANDLERMFMVVGSATAAAASACEGREAHRIAALLAPFSVMPPISSPAIGYQFSLATAELAAAQRVSACDRYRALLKIVSSPVKGMDDGRREQTRLGCLHGLAQASAERADPSSLELADQLERGSAFFAPLAETVRVGFYANRGDDQKLELHRARTEALALRGGISWSALTVLTVRCVYAYTLVGNVIGMVRVISDLERLLSVSASLRAYHTLARAHLDMLRGHYDSAIARYEEVLTTELGRQLTTYRLDCAFHAMALNGSGAHARARELCLTVLSDAEKRGQDADDRDLQIVRQQLALAAAGLGDYGDAVAIIDAQLAAFEGNDNPVIGLVYRDRAQIAIAMNDAQAYRDNAAQAEALLRGSRNPWLIGQYEGLATRAARAGIHSGDGARAPQIDSLDDLNSTVIEEAAPGQQSAKRAVS